MKYTLLFTACLFTSCVSTKSDWTELMSREELHRVDSQTYVSDMGTTYITTKDASFFLKLFMR